MIERNDTRWGRVFDLFIQATIFITLLLFSIETLPGLSQETIDWLEFFNMVTVAIFTVEYVLRIWVADRPLAYIFSFFGLIDLLAILPFYVAAELDMRGLRAFRFLRLFRAFKLVRYSKAISRFHRAFLIAKEEIVLFLCVALLLLFFSAAGIYYFENEAQPEKFSSVFHSLWWSVETLTTVGYGDIVPITVGGKVFTLFILLIGLGIVSVPAGLVASALSKARSMEE
ncbi:MAG: ion transporter [Bythopirellula sp.]|nr:ion transporter [Bythopirellula sp.]